MNDDISLMFRVNEHDVKHYEAARARQRKFKEGNRTTIRFEIYKNLLLLDIIHPLSADRQRRKCPKETSYRLRQSQELF